LGCGEGQYLWYAQKRFPHLRYCGVDRNAQSIALNKRYARMQRGAKVNFFAQDLERAALPSPAGLILCASVLHYVADDLTMLKKAFAALRPGGSLVLYLPVRGRSVLPWYRHLKKHFPHYDQSQGLQRVYDPEQLHQDLESLGFGVEQDQSTYRTLGILSNELQFCGITLAQHGPWISRGLMFLLTPLWMAMCLLLAGLDVLLPFGDGNGRLYLLRKPH
jgi:Trans-aconitate methyltransferase